MICAMLKQTAVKHFGSGAALARALGRTQQAVDAWDEVVPEGMAYKIQVITRGRVRVDVSLYGKKKRKNHQ